MTTVDTHMGPTEERRATYRPMSGSSWGLSKALAKIHAVATEITSTRASSIPKIATHPP